MIRIILLLATLCAACALRVPTFRRADILKSAAAATGLSRLEMVRPPAAWAVEDDDDINEDEEVPMVGSTTGRKQKAKPFEKTPAKADAEAGKAAFANIVAARGALKRGDTSAESVRDLGSSLLTLVQSPLLGAAEKKQIGTPKTYGLGADVVYMVGGGDIPKAVQALDEVLVVCKSSGLQP